eukprot:jgi/Chlat1/5132/Chrsp33S05134
MLLAEESSPPGPGRWGVGAARLSKYKLGPSPISQTPQYVFYTTGRFLRLLSVYIVHQYLRASGTSSVQFAFWAAALSAAILLLLQRPWKARSLLVSQALPIVMSGVLIAVSIVLWVWGLRSAGPVWTTMAEYTGILLAAMAGSFIGKFNSRLQRAQGALAMIVACAIIMHAGIVERLFRLLRHSDTTSNVQASIGFWSAVAPMSSVLLLSMAARPMHSIPKMRKQMYPLSMAIAAMCLAPLALFFNLKDAGHHEAKDVHYDGSTMGCYIIFVVFGVVLHHYITVYGEDKLQIGTASTFHVASTAIVLAIMEASYGSSTGIPPLLVSCSMFGLGIHWSMTADSRSVMLGDTEKGVRRGFMAYLPVFLHAPMQHVLSEKKTRSIAIFLVINTAFMFVEAIYGFYSNSLSLISDACHMLFDCAALAIGLYASYMARFRSNQTYTYGYGRYEVLSGYMNAVLLVFVGVLVILESVERFLDPVDIFAEHLLLVSVLGLLVNLVGLFFFHDAHAAAHGGHCSHGHEHGYSHNHAHGHSHSHEGSHAEHAVNHNKPDGHAHHHEHSHDDAAHAKHESDGDGEGDVPFVPVSTAEAVQRAHMHHHHDHNMRGIFLHVLADTLGSVGVIISALLIQYKHWIYVDPVCSLLISVLIVYSAIPLAISSAEVLAQSTPSHARSRIQEALAKAVNIHGVRSCKASHFWSHTPADLVGSVRLQIAAGVDGQRVLREATSLIKLTGASELTVQVENAAFELQTISRDSLVSI